MLMKLVQYDRGVMPDFSLKNHWPNPMGGGRHPPFCVFFVPLKIVDRQPIPILVRIEFCKKFLKFQLIWLGFSKLFFSFIFLFYFLWIFYWKKTKKYKSFFQIFTKKNEKSAPENPNHINWNFKNFLQNSIRTKIGIGPCTTIFRGTKNTQKGGWRPPPLG